MPQGKLHRISVTENGSHGVIETVDRQMPFIPFDVDYRLDLLKVGDPVRYENSNHWSSQLRDGSYYGVGGAIKVKLDLDRAESSEVLAST
jgi:hypothetical protein